MFRNHELLVRKSNISSLHFKKLFNTLLNEQLLQVPSLLTNTFTTVNLMLLRSKPYDHILQLSTITCSNNKKLHDIARIFPLYPQLILTLSLI